MAPGKRCEGKVKAGVRTTCSRQGAGKAKEEDGFKLFKVH